MLTADYYETSASIHSIVKAFDPNEIVSFKTPQWRQARDNRNIERNTLIQDRHFSGFYMNSIFTTKNTFNLLAILAVLFVAAGCSHNQSWVKITHPGNYDLIQMGHKRIGEDMFRVTKAHDKIFYVHPNVFGPTYFSVYLLEHTEIHRGESVLDVGAGSGIQAVYAAEKASHILATDIDDVALKNTLLNARRHGVEDKISVRKSDLFNALKPDEKFDVIISSIPYAWNEGTQGNWKLQQRFFLDAGKHLNPNGRIYFLTGLLDNLPRTKKLIENNNLKIMRTHMAYDTHQNLEPIVYVIQHTPVAPIDGSTIN